MLCTDTYFFTKVIKKNHPGLEALMPCLEQQDWNRARTVFAAYIRSSLDSANYLSSVAPSVRRSFFMPSESWQQAADRITQGTVVSAGTAMRFDEGEVQWLANPTDNQYEEWTWQWNRHHDWQILGKRYLQTRDEKYALTFVGMLESWIRQAVLPEGAKGNETKCWRTIEAGIRMKDTWPYAIHAFLASEHLTDGRIVDFFKSIWQHGIRLHNEHQQANWLIMEMNGLAHIGLLYPFFQQSQHWKDYALMKMEEELERQFYPDGFQYELSTGYHQAVIANYVQLAQLCGKYGEPLPSRLLQGLESAFELNLVLMLPDGRLPDLNDGGQPLVSELMKASVELFPKRPDFRWAMTNGKQGQAPAWTTRRLPYSGFFILRSDWSADAIWALFDAGPFGRAHQHEDKLNLLLYAYGRWLLREAGTYAYDRSEMRSYVLSTRAHNTVRVDGCDQNRRLGYQWQDEMILQPCEDTGWREAPGVFACEGVYTEGYGTSCGIRVEHKRKVFYAAHPPADLTPFFLVVDHMQPEDSAIHKYEVLWHSSSDTVRLHGSSAVCGTDDEARLHIMASANQSLSRTVLYGQQSPEWQGWRVSGQGLQGEYEPAQVLNYTLSASGEAMLVTLLYPVRTGEQCPVRDMNWEERDGCLLIKLGSAKRDHCLRIRIEGLDLFYET